MICGPAEAMLWLGWKRSRSNAHPSSLREWRVPEHQKHSQIVESAEPRGQSLKWTHAGGLTLAPGVYDQDMIAHLAHNASRRAAPAETVSRSGSSITIDPQAVAQATASLYETLKRCEDERAKLTTLVQDARQVSHQQHQASRNTLPAMTAAQVTHVPTLDAWISRRLADLHDADHALDKRQQKLEKLEASLGRLAQGLSSQIQEINQAKAELLGEYDSIEARLSSVKARLSQEAASIQQHMDDQTQRVETAQAHIQANLHSMEEAGKQAITALNAEFDTQARQIAGRLEGLRKPVDRWLQQHLTQYETMLNERIEKAHQPIARRIEDIQQQVNQAIRPVEQELATHQQQLMSSVQEFAQQASQSLEQQTRDVQQTMVDQLEKLDQQIEGLLEPVQAKFDTCRRLLLEEAGSFPAQFDEQWASFRQAMTQRIGQQHEAFRQQLASELDPVAYQVSSQLEVLKTKYETSMEQLLAGQKDRVIEVLAGLDQQMNLGLENLGGKAGAMGNWFESRRKAMSQQMEELQAQAMAAVAQAQRIVERGQERIRQQSHRAIIAETR
jgi:hypothetical protein